uniref:Uncharacterized protein n=1 Tax=Cynoglossus semilaevis TaxID=244447 RepID=A0A3P8W7J0_CYNSE
CRSSGYKNITPDFYDFRTLKVGSFIYIYIVKVVDSLLLKQTTIDCKPHLPHPPKKKH